MRSTLVVCKGDKRGWASLRLESFPPYLLCSLGQVSCYIWSLCLLSNKMRTIIKPNLIGLGEEQIRQHLWKGSLNHKVNSVHAVWLCLYKFKNRQCDQDSGYPWKGHKEASSILIMLFLDLRADYIGNLLSSTLMCTFLYVYYDSI